MKTLHARPVRWGYLLAEAGLFLVLCYLVVLGGTQNVSDPTLSFAANLGLIIGVGGGWLAWRSLRHRSVPATHLNLAFLALLVVTVLTALTSTDPRRSAVMVWQVALYFLVFCFLVDMLRSGLAAELLVKTILLSSLPVILVGFFQIGAWIQSWYALGDCVGGLSLPSFRVDALLWNPNVFAGYLNLLLPLGVMRSLASRKFARLGWAAWSLAILILEFFTSSRGGWLSTAVVLGVIGLYLATERLRRVSAAGQGLKALWRQVWRRKALVLGAAALLVILAAGAVSLMAWQLNNATHAGSGLNPNSRTYIWVVAWKMFLAHPLTGNGPWTFGTQFIQAYSVPTSALLLHAHNIEFNVLGESGLLGIAALGFMAWALASLCIRRWRSASNGDKLMVVGLVASLAGLAIHSQFDIPTYLPVVAILAVCVAAILAAGDQSDPVGEHFAKEDPSLNQAATQGLRQRLRLGWATLVVVWLVVIAGLAWQIWAYLPYRAGMAAAQNGDWQAAAGQLDLALKRDPFLALSWFQAGFVHGELALDAQGNVASDDDLVEAILEYQEGLALEPSYATNWANLGLLEWAAGDRTEALTALQKAAEAAPLQPAFRLTWGRMLEAIGDLDEAQAAYQQVLQQESDWAGSYFFRATPLRQAVVLALPAAATVPPAETSPANTPACQVRQAWFLPVSPSLLISDLFAMGSASAQQGRLQDSIKSYEQGLSILDATNSWGIGQNGISPYTALVFNRPNTAEDLLPGLDYPIYTDDVVNSMVALAEVYQKTGDTASAIRLYNKIVMVAPDNAAALARLAELSPK